MPHPSSRPAGRSGCGRSGLVAPALLMTLGIALSLAGRQARAQSPDAPAPDDAPVSPEAAPPRQPPQFAIVADPASRLVGISGVRLTLAMSAREAEACAVTQADVETASLDALRSAGLPVIDLANVDAQAAATVPELFVSVTIVHDETDVCAGSLLLQLGLDTSVVLLYRNVDTAPGTLRLSNAYAELDQSAALLVGVPPTFGNEIRGEIGRRIDAIAGAIVANNPAPR